MQMFYSELAQKMEPAWVIALSEHLDWITEHAETFPHSEFISQSESAWKTARKGYKSLETEFIERIEECKKKWKQRFETEKINEMIETAKISMQTITNEKEREKAGTSLYYSSVHLMIGDMQKILVTLNSRSEILQDKVRKFWYESCPNEAYSKILPTIEASLQNKEMLYFAETREFFPKFAMRNFLQFFASKKAQNETLNHYLNLICNYICKLSVKECRFYSKKWALYSKGFNNRQKLLPLS